MFKNVKEVKHANCRAHLLLTNIKTIIAEHCDFQTVLIKETHKI